MGTKGYWKVSTIQLTASSIIADGSILTIMPEGANNYYAIKWGTYTHDTGSANPPDASTPYSFKKTTDPKYSGKIRLIGTSPGAEIIVGVIGDEMPGLAGDPSTNADVFVAVRTEPPPQ